MRVVEGGVQERKCKMSETGNACIDATHKARFMCESYASRMIDKN